MGNSDEDEKASSRGKPGGAPPADEEWADEDNPAESEDISLPWEKQESDEGAGTKKGKKTGRREEARDEEDFGSESDDARRNPQPSTLNPQPSTLNPKTLTPT